VSLWLDTSVLVALYVPESRSERVAKFVRRAGEPIPFSPLHELELANALRLRLFRREARRAAVDATLARIGDDLHEGVLLRTALDWPATFAKAVELSGRFTPRIGSRSLDLLHVAAALLARSERFVSADRRQSAVARGAGLRTTRFA
jgi:predicted nucleic acid-binding protein